MIAVRARSDTDIDRETLREPFKLLATSGMHAYLEQLLQSSDPGAWISGYSDGSLRNRSRREYLVTGHWLVSFCLKGMIGYNNVSYISELFNKVLNVIVGSGGSKHEHQCWYTIATHISIDMIGNRYITVPKGPGRGVGEIPITHALEVHPDFA